MMKVCASLSSASDIDRTGDADMVEIRLDLMEHVPDIRGRETIVTFRGPVDLGVLPEGFGGMIDIGTEKRPDTGLEIIASYHDHDSTPGDKEILSILGNMDSDVSKAAFSVWNFKDLVSILNAARSFGKRHVILGMGSMGTVTRIRQDILGNEFTFGYVGEPTAPGQIRADTMSGLGDGCMVLGIIGRPLDKSRSPQMHNAALRSFGIKGIYLPFEAPDLDHAAEAIRGYDIRGVSVTIPYKQEMMDIMDTVDKDAAEIGAVNTVVNDGGRLKGYNTDVTGIGVALERSGTDIRGARALIMGSGGAARACAHHLTKNGCDITVTGRNRDAGSELAKSYGAEYRLPDSVPVAMYDLVVNCTPVGMYSEGPYPVNISAIDRGQTVFDMVYGETRFTETAKKKGCRVAYGEDMLAGQGAAAFELWTGRKDAFEVMRRELD